MVAAPTRLYGVPAPLFCESPTSWVQRICQQYDLTYRKFLACIQRSTTNDIDLALRPESYAALAKVCGLNPAAFDLMRLSLGRCVWIRGLRELLGFREAVLPHYRFCCLCWRADATPYLRVEWRFARWAICPVHRLPMNERCPVCDESLQMQRAVLGGAGRVVESMAHCYCCGCDMRKLDAPKIAEDAAAATDAVIRTQRAIVSAVAHGYFFMDGLGERPLPLRKLPVWLRYGVLEGGGRTSLSESAPEGCSPLAPGRPLSRSFMYRLTAGSQSTSSRRRAG